jgi:hypothetical protein
MLKRLALVTLLLATPVAARQSTNGMAVHEWGTFTSVAGPDGSAIEWQPLAGPSDLPCFVGMIKDNPKVEFAGAEVLSLSNTRAKVRMETPVLYFYSPREATVDVGVSFPHGLITEWYPQAYVQPGFTPFDLTSTTSGISWNQVRVVPGAKADFPVEPRKSHYYAARETDATPLLVGGQFEKFLFYRGLANFTVPVSAKVDDHGRIIVDQTSSFDIAHVVLFENRGGRLGYRVAAAPRGRSTIDRPELANNFEFLRWDLERLLTGQGLYPREARAMVETWRDSWFEEGTRLFYVLPKAAVDAILPLEVYPKPAEIARAFVGRLEILTPEMQNDVEQAILKNDLPSLDKYGRFLEPIARRLLAKPAPRVDAARVDAILRLIAASHVPEAPCK